MREGDLRTRARVYALTAKAWSRIQPELTKDEQCGFMADYLLECLELNRLDEEFVHSGFEAGFELAAWLKHLDATDDATAWILTTERQLASLYRRGDTSLRERIETAFLEHALERPAMRPYFEHWGTDALLRDAHRRALEWADNHSEVD